MNFGSTASTSDFTNSEGDLDLNDNHLLRFFRTVQHTFSALLADNKTRRILYGGLILLSLVFIGYALANNWSELTRQDWEINFRFIALAVLLYPLGMLPTVAAWHALLRAIDIQTPFSKNLRFYTLSSLPRHIPGLVWHISSRSLLYKEIGVSGTRIVVATGLETVLLTLTGSITSLVWLALTQVYNRTFFVLQIIAFAAVVTLAVFLVWTPGFNRALRKLQARWGIQQPIQVRKKEIVISLGWMFAAWGGGGVILFVLTRGFLPIEWSLLPSMIGIWGAAGAISLSIGALIQGMGLREITLAALLSSLIPMLSAAVIAISFRLALTAGEILWVLIFTWITKTPPGNPEGGSGENNAGG